MNDTVQTQAERWYTRRRASDFTSDEQTAFAQWREAHPSHARAFAETEELWRSIGTLADDADMRAWREEAREAVAEIARPQSKRRWMFHLTAIAATLLLAIFLVQFAMGERYRTERGEQKTVTLADGSTLLLNTDTEVRVRLSDEAREVKLIRGEALFTVSHDSARPFRTLVGDDVITDLGTRFAVRRGERWNQVDVLEGRVEISRGTGYTAILDAGEQLRTVEGAWRKHSAPVESLARWADGRLIFHDAPLAEVVEEVNRYGPGRLTLENGSLGDLRVSGDFRIAEPRTLVRALEAAFPIRVEVSGEDVRLFARP